MISPYEQLKSSNLSDEAAKGIANVIQNVVETDLATKTDIEFIRVEIEKTKAVLKTDIELIRAEVETTKAVLKTDIELIRAEIEKTKAEIQRDIQFVKADILKWVAGMLIAQGAVVATLVKLL